MIWFRFISYFQAVIDENSFGLVFFQAEFYRGLAGRCRWKLHRRFKMYLADRSAIYAIVDTIASQRICYRMWMGSSLHLWWRFRFQWHCRSSLRYMISPWDNDWPETFKIVLFSDIFCEVLYEMVHSLVSDQHLFFFGLL